MTTIAVTAARGKLGSEIAKATVEIVGKENVVGLARPPSKVGSLGVEIRPGDYESPADLEKSLDAVDTVLLVSGMDAPEKRIEQHRNVGDLQSADSLPETIDENRLARRGGSRKLAKPKSPLPCGTCRKTVCRPVTSPRTTTTAMAWDAGAALRSF